MRILDFKELFDPDVFCLLGALTGGAVIEFSVRISRRPVRFVILIKIAEMMITMAIVTPIEMMITDDDPFMTMHWWPRLPTI